MLKRRSGLDVVFALHVGHVRTKSRVRQLSLLIERRRRTTGNESRAVREHVSARIVVKAILTDRKSTRLNSSHVRISYAVFCLKKKNISFSNVAATSRAAAPHMRERI